MFLFPPTGCSLVYVVQLAVEVGQVRVFLLHDESDVVEQGDLPIRRLGVQQLGNAGGDAQQI